MTKICYQEKQSILILFVMERKEFTIVISAPASKVWEVLWGKSTYSAWTAAFMEGSKVLPEKTSETDIWKKGNRVRFLGPDNDGMISEIADNRSNEYMSIRHLGVVSKGVADLESPQSRDWAGSMENYTLKTSDGKTTLTVAMDITEDYLKYFQAAWPQALEKVKSLAEGK